MTDFARDEPMRVVYDVSLLGRSAGDHMNRTGVFRVAVAIAAHLARREDCRLWFAASESFEVLDLCVDYLRADPRLARVPLIAPPSLAVKRRLFHTLATLHQEVTDASVVRARVRAGQYAAAIRDLKPHKRLLRRSTAYASRALGEAPMPAHWARRVRPEIFHSPIGPLPRDTRDTCDAARVITIHDLIPLTMPHLCTPPQGHMLQSILDSIRTDDWVLAVSQATKDALCEYTRIDPARVFVTHLSADPRLFRPCVDAWRHSTARRKYGIPAGPYFLTLSTIEPRKNMDHVIRCFARFVRESRVRNVSLVLVGAWGWMYNRVLEALAEHPDVRQQVVMTGYVADEDLPALYSGALAFVFPSLCEGFGLTALEAMQCGAPVIASNTSSLPEVVGDAGILIDPRDEDALCESLHRVHADSSLPAAMRTRSLARASHFTWERCLDETVSAYRTALDVRGRRGGAA